MGTRVTTKMSLLVGLIAALCFAVHLAGARTEIIKTVGKSESCMVCKLSGRGAHGQTMEKRRPRRALSRRKLLVDQQPAAPPLDSL